MRYFDISLPLCSSASVGLYLGDAGFELRLGYGQHLLRLFLASLILSKHIPGSISMRTQLLPSEFFSVHHFDLYIEWNRLAASTDAS
jgi:hypothetical protein